MIKHPVLLSLLVACAGIASGHAADAKPAAAPALPPADTRYELRGFFGSGDESEISLAPKGEKDSRWYRVGKKTGDVTVEKADAVAGTAVIVRGGVRSSLRLAAASPAEQPAASGDEPEETKPDLKSREYRRKRIKEMMEQSTPAQKAEFGRVLREKFTALQKEHPDYFKDMKTPEDRRRVGDLSLAIMREAAEASAKIPGADGTVKPLPDDFDALMRAEHEDNMARWEKREAEKKPADAPAPETRDR